LPEALSYAILSSRHNGSHSKRDRPQRVTFSTAGIKHATTLPFVDLSVYFLKTRSYPISVSRT
jgi:hypothetical protein